MNVLSVAGLAAAVLLAVTALAQWRTSKSQLRVQETELIAQIRKEWHGMQESWNIVVLVGRGEQAFYQIADRTVFENYRRDLEETQDAINDRGVFLRYQSALRDIMTFCSGVADLIMMGTISLGGAYSVFGSPFLRHSTAIRRLLSPFGEFSLEKDSPEARLQSGLRQWSTYHYGLSRRTLLLIDLLWSEGAARWDLPPTDILSVSKAKESTLQDNLIRLKRELDFYQTRKLTKAFLKRRLFRQLGRSKLDANQRKHLEEFSYEWTDRLLGQKGIAKRMEDKLLQFLDKLPESN